MQQSQFIALGKYLMLAAAGMLVGCGSGPTTIPNPFVSVDRVPPPMARTPPAGAALPYYQAPALPANGAPAGPGTPPPALPAQGYAPAPAPLNSAPSAAPYNSAPYNPAPAYQAAPPAASPYTQQPLSSAGKPIAVPSDGADLRFARAPEPSQPSPARTVAPTPQNWQAGAAPARTTVAATPQVQGTTTFAASQPSSAPRVRMPSSAPLERRPMDLANLPARPQSSRQAPPSGSQSVANDPDATLGWQ